jgi:leucyl aminopeptidase
MLRPVIIYTCIHMDDAAQNFARELMEAPGNKMTPTIFAQTAKVVLQNLPNITVLVHDRGNVQRQTTSTSEQRVGIQMF